MKEKKELDPTLVDYIPNLAHAQNDYFGAITTCLGKLHSAKKIDRANYWQGQIENIYSCIADEIITNTSPPRSSIQFGTSGWRGIIGKDLNLRTVSQVTQAIMGLYFQLDEDNHLAGDLGVRTSQEAQERGCVLGYDNRFGNDLFARKIMDILSGNGFQVYFAGESTTGTLSASVLELQAAFSINLTPSHNPLEYGGFKFNAADGGPASKVITDAISQTAQSMVSRGILQSYTPQYHKIKNISALPLWQNRVRSHVSQHGIHYDTILKDLSKRDDIVIVVDSVHGASRCDIRQLLGNLSDKHILFLRTEKDPTFGGIAPEPSDANLQPIHNELKRHKSPLKLGVIMDPDADRVRFTDGTVNIDMNQFGAMSYHFLHTTKKKTGLVAKSVATSNFANAIATAWHEEIFEPKVGFKEFKPVIEKALVCFEESDGITVRGHTPEKDAYIGLFLALDMTMTLNINLGQYLDIIQEEFGTFFPGKDAIVVSQKGAQLLNSLNSLNDYCIGQQLLIGEAKKTITKILTVDGHKFIFEDESWLMIRPSGTEPKVRFYVEGRSEDDKNNLFTTAQLLLKKIKLL